MKVLALSGSLREKSLNTALLHEAMSLLPEGSEWEVGDIGSVPLYNEDLDGDDKPASVRKLLDQVARADALVIATPEYNYGIPGGLKNAIDWISRPAFKSVLVGKPTLLMTASKSTVGGVRCHGQLKQVLAGTLTAVYPAPEFALGSAHTQITDGKLADQDSVKRLERLITEFAEWVKTAGAPAPSAQ